MRAGAGKKKIQFRWQLETTNLCFWLINILLQKFDTSLLHQKKNENDKKHKLYYKQLRTFNIERTTIFKSSFCIGLVTQLNVSALGVIKHHYITKRIRELLIGNSRFFILNSLSQLLCYTDIKESCLSMTEIVETLHLNN